MKKHVLIHKQVPWTWNQDYFSTVIGNVNIVFLLKIRNAFHIILTVLLSNGHVHTTSTFLVGFYAKWGYKPKNDLKLAEEAYVKTSIEK